MDPFLASPTWIDHEHPDVAQLAGKLRGSTVEETARRSFEWVRDEVRHSFDFQANPVTCRASDALQHRTGYCYAKAHLLVALLRANGVRAGLCYRRLSLRGGGAPFSLHGLVAVELPGVGWYRADPRGNKPGAAAPPGPAAPPGAARSSAPSACGVDARFTPPVERLAFEPRESGEREVPGVHAEPLAVVVEHLTRHATWDALLADLPDQE